MVDDPTDPHDNSTAVAPQLTERQRRWVEEYLVDPNATQAAIRAGYSVPGARVQGVDNLTNPNIRKILDEERQKRAEHFQVYGDRILQELLWVGLSDIRDVVTWDAEGKPTFCPAEDLSPGVARAITQIHFMEKTSSRDGQTLATTREIRFRFHDKKGALDSLMKHLGLFQKPKPAGEDEPPGSGSDQRTEERPEVHSDWNRLSNDEWTALKRVRTELKELLAKAAVPAAVAGE